MTLLLAKSAEEFETEEYYFEVMLPSNTSLSKGKKMVLMNTLRVEELGKSLIVVWTVISISCCKELRLLRAS